ncbi:MAG: OmpH family outer membrane protein [Bacteroidetes bacterium]|nr:MAG: OmpH family outer membrane protein [Bacteroidota bacterium]
MKKLIFLITILLFSVLNSFSQKYAYVNTDYILSNIPKYESAQEQLNLISNEWQKEIEDLYNELDKMNKEYLAEEVLLTDEMKVSRKKQITEKEKKVRDLQKKRFGQNGDLFKKRQELIKPIQDDIFNAIKELAVESNYAVIFDSAGSLSMLYTDPKYDKSDEILKKLGFEN